MNPIAVLGSNFAAFIDGYKVFKSVDGGQNWINLSTPTLDGHKPTNIEHQRGSNGGLYLGTRTTVFYRNDSMPDWVIYDNNLPKRTFSTQLVPYYREGLLINGTNRSAYEIDLYENTSPSAPEDLKNAARKAVERNAPYEYNKILEKKNEFSVLIIYKIGTLIKLMINY